MAELHSTEPDQILLAAESRLSSTHSASANVAPTMPAPQHLHATVAKQIADTLKTSSDRSIELTLSPAELGRVRMSLSTTDAGVSIIIHAERPETLDLMRRNIGELDREFTDMGYTDVDFAFSGGDGAQDQPDNPSGKGSGTTAPESPIVATHSDERQGALLSPDSAMDLRI